jgi:uncharacterized protein
MNTGICKLKLHIPESNSLKDKRRIIKSIIARMKKQFNISIAEVEDNDLWRVATLGISCVSNHEQHVDETLNHVMDFIVQHYPTLEIVDHEIEILHGL